MNHRIQLLVGLVVASAGCSGSVTGGFPDADTDQGSDTSVHHPVDAGPPLDGGPTDSPGLDSPEELPPVEDSPGFDSPEEEDLDAPETLPPIDSSTDSGACTAASSVTLTPVLHVDPPAADCTPALIDQIIADCYSDASADASTTGCEALITGSSAAATCLEGCMETDTVTSANVDTASAPWGGIILVSDAAGQVGFYNLGGCVAALDPSSAGQACATALEGNIECLVSACSSCSVPTTDNDAELQDYYTCEEAAEPATGSGACTSYAAAVDTDCAFITADAAASPASACFAAVSTLESPSASPAEVRHAIKVIVGPVCAPGVIDGG